MGYEARLRQDLDSEPGQSARTERQDREPARILSPSAPMDTPQGTRLRKSPSTLRAQQSTEGHSLPLTHANLAKLHKPASIQSNRSNQEQEIEKLKATLKQVRSSAASLKAEVRQLETSLEQSLANQSSLKRDHKKRLARAASTETSLREEIEKLKTSLTRSASNEASLKREVKAQRLLLERAATTESSRRQEIEKLVASVISSASNEATLRREVIAQRSLLEQAASTELALKRKIDELKESKLKIDELKGSLAGYASTISKLREDKKVIKTSFTHALTSERDMRTSARETREEWEKVEKSLRDEIAALRLALGITGNDSKGGKVASGVQRTIEEEVGPMEGAIALKQPHTPLEGSSDVHILLDDLALQSLAAGNPNPTPHSIADEFGSRLLPEFTALERATTGLQQAVNSELRNAYAGKCLSTRCLIPQRSSNVARNLRLLVILWETSGAVELMSSVTSILSDTTATTGGEDCPICTDTLLPEHKIAIEGCGHAMCKGCLREYIGARLGERVWPVQCPICMANSGPKSRAQAITRVLVDELILPTTVLSQWTDFELSQFIIPVTCPKCAKPNLFELAEYNRSTILICNHACECAWCRDCSRRVNIEEPHDCGDNALEDLAGKRQWMRCPRPSCRVMVEKNVGCNHITCRCGTHFCYRCGEDITGKVSQHACLKQP